MPDQTAAGTSAAAIPSGPPARAAFGMVAPFDLELDRELWRWLPDDVDLLLTRTPFLDETVTVDFVQHLSKGTAIPDGVRSVLAGRAETVAYACTSASFVGGRAGEEAIRASMVEAGAENPVTTSGSIVEALQRLGVRRASVATPYLPELSVLLDGFLGEHGVEAVANESLGLDRNIWDVTYADTADLVRRVDRPEAEAVVLSCTNLPTYDLIAPLEREIGKPIVSANQATVWASLRRIGRAAIGAGQALIEA